jgi:hypothetical protein
MTHNYYKYKDFSGYSIKKLRKENIKSGDIFLVAYHKPQNLIGDLLMKVKLNTPITLTNTKVFSRFHTRGGLNSTKIPLFSKILSLL